MYLQTKFARRAGACAAVKEDILNKVEFVAGGDRAHLTPFDLYQGTAYSVREKLFDSFNKTHKYWACASLSALGTTVQRRGNA